MERRRSRVQSKDDPGWEKGTLEERKARESAPRERPVGERNVAERTHRSGTDGTMHAEDRSSPPPQAQSGTIPGSRYFRTWHTQGRPGNFHPMVSLLLQIQKGGHWMSERPTVGGFQCPPLTPGMQERRKGST